MHRFCLHRTPIAKAFFHVMAHAHAHAHGLVLVLALALLGGSAYAASVSAGDVIESLQSRATVVVLTIAIVIACVVLHYEMLNWLAGWLKRIHVRPRRHILVLIFAILIIHVIEIWVFGVGYFYLIQSGGHGALMANHTIGFLDCIYYSAVCFTTLGLGDVIPVGAVRFVTGTESLTGFVLVTWSASFTFMEMQRFWKN